MKIAGIIAEYNPFHNGHAYHIEQTRAEKGGDASHIVAVMSGCFTQRGEPALADPYVRAKAALQSGVDLVIALPTPWSLSSAEGFAAGGVSLLHALGCVDTLSFGSECGDVDALKTVARVANDPRVIGRMRGLMSTGLSYAAARRQAVAETAGENRAKLLDTPNNTLGIEYLSAIARLDSPMTPFTTQRMGVEHDALSPIGGMASASYLREVVRAGRINNLAPFVPHGVCRVFTEAAQAGHCPSREALAERAVLSTLRALPKEALSRLPAISEGLDNRLYNAISEATDLESLIEKTKTKRYVRTRIQRLIYNAFLGIDASFTESAPPYIHVLGATAAGKEVLRAAKERGATLPIITRVSQIEALDDRAKRVFDIECRAADLYALFLPTPYPRGKVMTEGLITV